jgi:hypothetical protein
MFTQVFKITLALLVASTLFVACSKEDSVNPQGPVTITGKWVGKYGYDSDDPSFYYCFNIKSDGSFQEMNKSQEVLGTGSWQLVGDVFTATVT